MSMKPIALVIAALVVILQFILGDYDKADSNLQFFYAQIVSTNFSGARASIDEAIRLWPGNSRYYGWRAYCTSQTLPSQCTKGQRGADSTLNGRDQVVDREAIADYHRALELNSRDAVAYHNLAWLEHLLGDDTAATRDWHEATLIDPDNVVYHLSYGMFLEEAGSSQAAIEQYETAIEISPSILDSPFFASYRIRSSKEAEFIVENLISMIEGRLLQGSDPILEARLGKLYQYKGNLARAAQLLEDAARKLPNLPLVWLNLGDVHAAQGDATEAMICYKKATMIDISAAGPYLRMGEIDILNGQKNIAADNLNLAAQRWQRVNPISAAHNNRLYNGPRQKIDDLLPTTFVWYVTPCEASRAWSGLSQLFPARLEYARGSQTCEDLPAPHVTAISK